MKITASRLRRLIKEEISVALSEAGPLIYGPGTAARLPSPGERGYDDSYDEEEEEEEEEYEPSIENSVIDNVITHATDDIRAKQGESWPGPDLQGRESIIRDALDAEMTAREGDFSEIDLDRVILSVKEYIEAWMRGAGSQRISKATGQIISRQQKDIAKKLADRYTIDADLFKDKFYEWHGSGTASTPWSKEAVKLEVASVLKTLIDRRGNWSGGSLRENDPYSDSFMVDIMHDDFDEYYPAKQSPVEVAEEILRLLGRPYKSG